MIPYYSTSELIRRDYYLLMFGWSNSSLYKEKEVREVNKREKVKRKQKDKTFTKHVQSTQAAQVHNWQVTIDAKWIETTQTLQCPPVEICLLRSIKNLKLQSPKQKLISNINFMVFIYSESPLNSDTFAYFDHLLNEIRCSDNQHNLQNNTKLRLYV